MADTLGFQPIVNGSTQTVNELVAQVTINGTVAFVPVIEIAANGALNASNNPVYTNDPLALVNTGSIVSNTSAANNLLGSLVAQGVTAATVGNQAAMIANQGSQIALTGTQIANGGSQIALTGSMVAQLGSIAADLAGTLDVKPAGFTLVALDNSNITNAGTAVNALNAGHAIAGGVLRTENASGFYVNQIGAAGTVDGGSTFFMPAGTAYNVIPSAGAVSVNAITNGVTIAGYGFE